MSPARKHLAGLGVSVQNAGGKYQGQPTNIEKLKCDKGIALIENRKVRKTASCQQDRQKRQKQQEEKKDLGGPRPYPLLPQSLGSLFERKEKKRRGEEKEVFIPRPGAQKGDARLEEQSTFSQEKGFLVNFSDIFIHCEEFPNIFTLFLFLIKLLLVFIGSIFIFFIQLVSFLKVSVEKMESLENMSRAQSSPTLPTPVTNGNGAARRQVTVNMPMPGTAEFPLFEGDEATNFLKRFETACNRCYYTSEERFLEIGLYCTRPVQMQVETFDSYNEDWDKFKKEFLKEFKQRDPEQLRKSRAFLGAYANNSRKEENLKDYCRTFDMISKELFEDNRLDEITRAELFLRGLPPIAQRKVVEKCQINSDEPENYNYKKWATQAMRLVDSTITLDSIKQEGHVTELYDKVSKLYEKNKRNNVPKVEILQREPYNHEKKGKDEMQKLIDDFSRMKIASTQLQSNLSNLEGQILNKQTELGIIQEQFPTVATQYQPNVPPANIQYSVAAAQYQQNRNYNEGCFYCKDPGHRWRRCPHIECLNQEGLVHITQQGLLAFGEPCPRPDLVPQLPKEDKLIELKREAMKYREKMRRLAPVNSVDYEEVVAVANYTNEDFAIENTQVSAARFDNTIRSRRQGNPLGPDNNDMKVMKEKAKKEQSLPSVKRTDELHRELHKQTPLGPIVEELTDTEMDLGQIPVEPAGVKLPSQMQTRDATHKSSALPPLPASHREVLSQNAQSKAGVQKQDAQPKSQPKSRNEQKEKALTTNEQQRIEHLVAQTLAVKETMTAQFPKLKGCMNEEVQLTTRELVEFAKALLETPMAQVNNMLFHEVYTVCERGELARAPVRVETAQGSYVPVKALLDGGSAVCVCSSKLARALDQPWYTGENMGRIVGVNGAPSRVIGMIRDMPIHIGDAHLFIDCLIIPNAQYDLLLGVSFMKKGKARMEYAEDGRCDIELQDKKGKLVRFVATWGKAHSLN